MKTIVITGATGGIGLHSAIGLAKTGARVIVTGRNAERGETAVKRIREEAGSDTVELVLGDLSSVAGVDALADELASRLDRIDVLVNNAGLLANERRVSEDGFEMDFAVNVVAPHRLTHRLLPLLEAAKPARVLNLTGGKASGPFDPSDLQAEKSFVALPSYTQTKRAMEALAMHSAPELEAKGVYLTVVYPGRASTAMTQAMGPMSLPWYMRPAFPVFSFLVQRKDGGASAEKASRSTIYAATTPDLEGVSGAYIDTASQRGSLHPTVLDAANQALVVEAVGQVE
ncbi:MAG: SDR family NAD(P)-dependent oxidoreductase [Proteobacteria bacterium]|nr:SDR family NAD(P)-dependent oxidoreductase [Pseudomonadota bacterium]